MDTGAPHPEQAAVRAQASTARRGAIITITLRSLWMGALIALAILVLLFLVTRALGPLVLLVLAIVLAEAIRPLVARLKRYHIPGPLGVLLIYLVVLLVVGILLWLLFRPLVNEVGAFANDLPRYLTQLQADVHRLERGLRAQRSVSDALDALAGSLAELVKRSIPALLSVPIAAVSGLFSLFIDLVIVLTMMLFWLMASETLKPFVVGLFPARSRAQAALVLSEIGASFGGYVRGVLISMVLIGLISGLGLTILGIPYALLFGVLTGFTALLPYIGPWISGTITVGVALIAVTPGKALEVIILFFVIFVVEGEIVQPLVMSRSVKLDPLLVLVSVLIGLSLLGVIGAVLAVPIAACVQVLVQRVLVPAIRRASERADQLDQASLSPSAGAIPAPVSVPEPRSLGDERHEP